MAVESKPLFHPEIIRRSVLAFPLPELPSAAVSRLGYWAELIASGRADTFKETALLPEFLTDIILAAFSTACGFSSASRSLRAHRPHARWRSGNQFSNFSE